MHNEKVTMLLIWFIAFLFPIIIVYRGILFLFINTGSLEVIWLLLPILISLGVVLKYKLARWIMLFWLYLLFFYEVMGTEIGVTICFSSTIWTLYETWSLDNFIDLLFVSVMYGFFIFVLSHDKSYRLFNLDKSIRIHELASLGLIAFTIMHLNMIYYWFLS